MGPIAAVHLAALILLMQTEYPDVPFFAGFLLCWALFNFVWLAVLRRPGVSAVLSLAMIAILIHVSELKFNVIMQTVNFVDLMVIDAAAIAYLLAIFPNLIIYLADRGRRRHSGVAADLASRPVPAAAASRRSRARLPVSPVSAASPWSIPSIRRMTWYPGSYVSNFARSGIDAISGIS